jgi:hypothetical protein
MTKIRNGAEGTPEWVRYLAGMNRAGFLSALAVFCAAAATAQPTLVDPVDAVTGSLSNPDDTELQAHWDVTNATDAPMGLMVTRSILQAVEPYNLPYTAGAPGAYDRFCWGPLCYNYGTAASNPSGAFLVTLQPGETNTSFISDYYPAGIAGVTAFQYCFHPVGDIAAGACHTVLYCVDAASCAVGIEEPKAPMLELAAWAGQVAAQVQLPEGERARLRVHAATGAVVDEVALGGSGSVFLDAERWAPGVYIVVVETASGLRAEAKWARVP